MAVAVKDRMLPKFILSRLKGWIADEPAVLLKDSNRKVTISTHSWMMAANYLPHQQLKAKVKGTNLAAPVFSVDLSFMQPALEPFLMIKATVSNHKTDNYGLQIISEDGREVYYLLFEYHPSFNEGDCIELFAVSQLRLREEIRWIVRSVMPDGRLLDIDEFRFCPLIGWHGSTCYAADKSVDTLMFIGGAPKSGTTWVERILNSHPDCLAIGENTFFDGAMALQYERALSLMPPPEFATGVQQEPPFRSTVSMLQAGRAERVLKQLAQAAGVTCVADKSPSNSDGIPQILASLPDARFVQCIRHPLDTAVSRFFHEQKLLKAKASQSALPEDRAIRSHVAGFNSERASVGEMFQQQALLDWALGEIAQANRFTIAARQSKRFHTVSYEDLLNNFKVHAASLFKFAGLPIDPTTLRTIEATNSIDYYRSPASSFRAHPSFFRKGIAGDHLRWLNTKQIAYAKNKFSWLFTQLRSS